MNRYRYCLAILLGCLCVIVFSGLRVYAYESLNWLKDTLIPIFEEQTGIEVTLVTLGDAGNILSRLILEKRRPLSDVVLGLDQSLAYRALSEGLLEPVAPRNADRIVDKSLFFEPEGYLYPFDYGALAIIYDPDRLPDPPTSFRELTTRPKSLLIQDPRNSSTGLAFFLWTVAVYREDWREYWKALRPAILTLTTGWSEGFAKFEAGEAPMMVSYATDGAYSYHAYGSDRYKAFIPMEGAFYQTEYVGVTKGTENPEQARLFVEFVLSERFQSEVPLNQWMFPTTPVELPEAYEHAVTSSIHVSISAAEVSKNLDQWLAEWEEIMY